MDQVNPVVSPSRPLAVSSAAAGHDSYLRHGSTLAELLCLALLGVLMGLAARRLFAGITTAGMTGVDTFDYWRIANDLLHGHYEPYATSSHRLSFYALNALALKVLGANDYAIRAFIGGFAVLNIALVYLLAQAVARNRAVALAAAALYAVNPVVMYYAGTELPHITGATFVMICSLLSLPATDRKADFRVRIAATFMMGVGVSAAVLTHEDLAFLGVGYFILVALPLTARTTAPGERRRDVALNAGAFVVGAVAAAACLMAIFGVTPWGMIQDTLRFRAEADAKSALGIGEFFATVPARMIRSFTVDALGNVVTGLAAVAAVAAPIAFAARRCEQLRRLLILAIPVVIYVVGFLGIGRIYLGGYQRLLIPLLGPTLVFALCGAFLLLRRPWRRAIAAALVAWAAYVVIGDRPWYFAPPAMSVHRQLYDAVKDWVGPQRKLLLPACFAIDFPYVGISSGVYLDGNVVPIYLMRDFVSLDALISANRAGYVFIPEAPRRGMWPRERIERLFRETYGVAMERPLLDALPRLPPELWRGDTRVEWTGAACDFEEQVLRQLLDRRGARVVLAVHNLGDVYELAR